MRDTGLRAEEWTRLRSYASRADVRLYIQRLQSKRDRILTEWLRVVERQPFHLGRPERAVSDEIPELLGVLMSALEQGDLGLLWDDEGPVVPLARRHAQSRAVQGLLPAEVMLEFRLLRETVLQTLLDDLPDGGAAAGLLGAQLLLSTALDGIIGVALNYFTDAIEEAKDDFVAVAAHDLRTPLTVLKGTVQLIKRRAGAGTLDLQQLPADLAAIEAEANRIDRLLTNLLDVTRVRERRLEIQPAPTDLYAVASRVTGRLGEEARNRVRITVEDQLPKGNWEESRIEQVVENLLTNALKYAPDGTIEVSVSRSGSNAVLQVKDQGIGLSPSDQAQLFRRFFRSPDVVERKLEGTGLGLYICRGIVEAHGGEIRAVSAGKGQGTTVIVTLPFAGPTQ